MELQSVKKVYNGRYIKMYDATFINNDGEEKVYEVASRDELSVESFKPRPLHSKPNAIGIIVFNQDMDKILVCNEFRLACNDWVVNFPGGIVEDGETVFDAAKRELWEETGLKLEKCIDTLIPSYTAVGISNEDVATVICTASGDFAPSTSVNEEITCQWCTRDEVKALLKVARMALRTQSFLYCWAMGFDLKGGLNE